MQPVPSVPVVELAAAAGLPVGLAVDLADDSVGLAWPGEPLFVGLLAEQAMWVAARWLIPPPSVSLTY